MCCNRCNRCNRCNCCNSSFFENNSDFPIFFPVSQNDLARLSDLAEVFEAIQGFNGRCNRDRDCDCDCGCNCGCNNSCCG